MKSFLSFIIILAAAMLDEKVEGKCQCPSIGGKVCGTNGVTYKNECRLKCAAATLPGLTVAAYTTCARHKHPCVCPNDYRPVCASDGITYKNQCEILCANTRDGKKSLNVEYLGDCTSDKTQQIQNRILTLISPYGKELPVPENITTTNNTTKGNDTQAYDKNKGNPQYNIFHEDQDNSQGASGTKPTGANKTPMYDIFHEQDDDAQTSIPKQVTQNTGGSPTTTDDATSDDATTDDATTVDAASDDTTTQGQPTT